MTFHFVLQTVNTAQVLPVGREEGGAGKA